MLFSILKQIFAPGRARAPLVDPESLPFYDIEQLEDRASEKVEMLRENYLDWPAFVHLETIALCNAACDFCPYPTLERKGTRMPDALIEKVVGDLAGIPRHVGFQLAPYKVSEPFLEPRLFDILALVNRRLPNARISIITNGAALTDRNVDRLLAVREVAYVNVSLNFDNAAEYESVMKIPFERTLRRLDALHERRLAGQLPFPVRLTRVSDNRLTDTRYVGWVRNRYPGFKPAIVNRNDWIGGVDTDAAAPETPDVPCHRWFDLSITATGKVAMCCMDGEVRYPKGDVNESNALDIYNLPRLRQLRQQLISRRAVGEPCNRCTYLNL